MTMNSAQHAIWMEIRKAYVQWSNGGNGWMPVTDLAIDAAPERIGEALAQAQSDGLAEVGNIGEQPGFRLVQA